MRSRLQDEAAEIGMNVSRAVQEQKIPLYEMSEQLEEFYRDGDAFVYETAVWNTCDTKQEMRDFVQKWLGQCFPEGASVFCFGDGLGFDSAWLAMQGHRVKYSEPSILCRKFAHQVFERNGVDVTELESIDGIAPESLDAVVCLDVLEHIPKPDEFVKMFRNWLKPEGLLFVHAPFWFLHWTRPTHLRENRKFSGDLRRMYHSAGLQQVDALPFWNPILLQRSDRPVALPRSLGARLRIEIGRHLCRVGRWNSTIHSAIARTLAKPPRAWRELIR